MFAGCQVKQDVVAALEGIFDCHNCADSSGGVCSFDRGSDEPAIECPRLSNVCSYSPAYEDAYHDGIAPTNLMPCLLDEAGMDPMLSAAAAAGPSDITPAVRPQLPIFMLASHVTAPYYRWLGARVPLSAAAAATASADDDLRRTVVASRHDIDVYRNEHGAEFHVSTTKHDISASVRMVLRALNDSVREYLGVQPYLLANQPIQDVKAMPSVSARSRRNFVILGNGDLASSKNTLYLCPGYTTLTQHRIPPMR